MFQNLIRNKIGIKTTKQDPSRYVSEQTPTQRHKRLRTQAATTPVNLHVTNIKATDQQSKGVRYHNNLNGSIIMSR